MLLDKSNNPSKKMSFKDALVKAQADSMRADTRVVLFGLDVNDHKRIFGSTEGLVEEFGENRVFSTPLSEDAMTGVALGAALNGLRPIHVHIRADFMLLGMNQIANMISCIRYLSGGKHKAPIVIRAAIGRGWGQGAQHSKTMQSVFGHIPGLKVVMPTTPQDAYSLLRASIEDDSPVIFLEHRWLYFVEDEVDLNHREVLGSAKVLSPGSDLTLICTSWMNVEAIAAKKILSKLGIDVEIVDLRSIAPIDQKTIIQSVQKTKRCVVADYDWVQYGVTSEIAAIVSKECFSDLLAPVERIGFQHVPCPTTRPLEDLFYPNAKTIIRVIEKMFKRSVSNLDGEEFFSYENKFRGPF